MHILFKRFYNKAGLDASIVYTISSRVIQAVGGIITLLLITQFLNKDEQGYYYTFGSIISIQIFFELGLTGIITQYIAHEAAHLSWKNSIELEGEAFYKSRLASVVRLGVIWIISIAVILFFVFLFAGQYFFLKFNDELGIRWETPWLILSIAYAVIIIINLLFAILEGLGKIKEVTRMRLWQQVVQLVCICAFFFLGFRLLASGVALLIASLLTALNIIASGNLKIITKLFQEETPWKINYKKEVLPFQLKIALGSMSGYLIYQLINPVLFATQGAEVAGQMGATQTFLNGILLVSLSWFSTKVAIFSTFVARKDYGMLNLSYTKSLHISIAVCITGIVVFALAVALLQQYLPAIGNRFLTLLPILFLGLTQVASVIGNAQAYYLRSFKKEPFFVPSIVIGIASGAVTVVCGKLYGVTEITFAYFLINGVIGFLWGCFIFKAKAMEWMQIRRWI